MRESATVGWDPTSSELQFIAEEPGPILLVTPEMFLGAVRQRDGSWLLDGYVDPDRERQEQFLLRDPTRQFALTLIPAASARPAVAQDAAAEPLETREGLSGWVPAPPQPPSAAPAPVSFYRPNQQVTETEAQTEIRPPEFVSHEDFAPLGAGGYKSGEQWVITYVVNDPAVPDETEKSMTVNADGDSGALRVFHSEMGKLEGERSYRVVALAPARALDVAP